MARNWKKMSKEEEDKKRQETIDKAIETMNKGIYEYLDSDRFKTLLDTMSKFHDYSMNNTLLILGQNPRATHLAGYNKWQQDFNRQVKRGEKGLVIWMPVEIKVKEKQYVLDENGNRILGDDGKFKKEEVVVKKHTFKIGYTFDVSQTEQIEGKEVVELSPVKELEGDVALLPDRIETEKKYRTILAEECEYFKDEIEANNLRDTEHFTFYDVNGNEYHDLKEAWDAIQECTKGYKLSDYKENKFVGRFMKADVLIGLGLAGEGIVIKMKTPLRTINVDSVNPVGRVNFNRMYKRINDIRYSLNKTIETIQNYEGNLKIAKEMVNKPFELQDELTSARNRQKEINKILDTSGNENSKVVVEDDLEEERNESCMEL